MTQIYDEAGHCIPVTVVQAGPCHVLQVRTKERDGYEAVQLGFLDKPRRLASRSERGHVAKLDSKRSKKLRRGRRCSCPPRPIASRKRFIREFRGPAGEAKVGQELTVDVAGRREGRRCDRPHQGPRLLGRHEAAQLRRPAGHARREEGASSHGRHRRPGCEPRWRPHEEGQEDARPVRQRARHDRAMSSSCKIDAENNLLLIHGCGARAAMAAM